MADIPDPGNNLWSDVANFHTAAAQLAKARVGAEGVGRMPLYSGGGSSLGSEFVNSRGYKDWTARFADGGPSVAGNYQSDPAVIPGGMRALLAGASDASGGALVPTQHLPGITDSGLYRPARLLPLLSTVKTTSDGIEYAKELSHTSSAAIVPEASALTGTTGTKPEGGITFTLVTETIRTLAVWIPATRRVIADAPSLRGHIDLYLRSELERALEDQVVSGDGIGNNMLGILNTSGVGTASAAAGENNLDVLRKAKRMVQVDGRTEPNGCVLNPIDAEHMDTAKFGSGSTVTGYISSGPSGVGNGPPAVWNMRVVVGDAGRKEPQSSATSRRPCCSTASRWWSLSA
jgi:HK97 family phage major capsid protein